MRVLAKILEDLFRAGKRALGVDHPVLAVQRVFQLAEALSVRELCTRTPQVEFTTLVGTGKAVEELAPEDLGQHANREQVVRAAGDPAIALRREPTAGHDAV